MPQPAKYPHAAARQAAYRARCQQIARDQAQERGLPPLPNLPAMPGTRRWKAALTLAHQLVEEICEQMQTYADQRSEAWQQTERAQEFAARLEAIQELREQMDPLL